MSGDLYRELGVDRAASDKDISSAYRQLAKENHPDANPGDKRAEDKFKRASAAYKILKDPETRARYDRGEIDENGQEMGMRYQRGSGFQQGGHGGAEFSGGFGGFDDILNDLFGGRAQSRTAQQPRGRDLKSAMQVAFVDAAKGTTQRLNLPDGRTVEVNIPAGIESGKILRLRRQGEHGVAGNGDLLVEVTVLPHPRMTRDGLDIQIDQPLPLRTAILGGKQRVETVHGDVNLTIPSWSSSGKTMRLRGKGIVDAAGNKGDQLVRFLIALPDSPDPDLEALMRESQTAAS